jgi:hypothetical protein
MNTVMNLRDLLKQDICILLVLLYNFRRISCNMELVIFQTINQNISGSSISL